MMNKLNALLGAGLLTATAAHAEIVLTDTLSLSGYIDMSASAWDAPDGEDSFDASVAEFEVDFNFTTDKFSAVAELSFDGTDASYETVAITYAVSDELSFTAGNMLSYLGWEAYDATGLYQYSYAYRGFSPLYPAYAGGASVDYVTDAYSVGVWVGEGSDEKLSIEVAGKYTGIEGLTIFAGYADDPGYETLNFWVSYEVDAFTFALEYVSSDIFGAYEGMDLESTGYLAMVNYASGNFGITFRYSVEEDDVDYSGEGSIDIDNWELFTISPSWTFSDNCLGLLEYSAILGGSDDVDYQIAAELIFMF